MGLRFKLYSWYAPHNRLIKIAISIGLIIIIILDLLLLIILFTYPEAFKNDAFVYPKDRQLATYVSLNPSVAVAILAIVLSGATITLVTRCVEESLWKSLTPPPNSNGEQIPLLSVSESRNVALWSISTAARLQYLVIGESNTLRIAGLCVLLCSVISPVLLSGISQEPRTIWVKELYEPRPNISSAEYQYHGWEGFYDYITPRSSRFIGQVDRPMRDGYGEAAFLTYLLGSPTPPADVCTGPSFRQLAGADVDSTDCLVNARIAGFQATCRSFVYAGVDEVNTTWFEHPWNSDPDRNPDSYYEHLRNITRARFCSSYSSKTCVELDILNRMQVFDRGFNLQTRVNFTNGRQESRSAEAPDDESPDPGPQTHNISIILGAFLRNYKEPSIQELKDASYKFDGEFNVVDCLVRYGWVNVTQNGTNPGHVTRDSFQLAPRDQLYYPWAIDWIYGYDPYLYTDMDNSQRGILYEGDRTSSWVFYQDDDSGTAQSQDGIFRYPVGAALLGYNRSYPEAKMVARRIEGAWDSYNLLSFKTNHTVADKTTTAEHRRIVYNYDSKVLLYLLVPLIATLAGCWGRWWIGDEDVVFGYDPLRIAQCGPVQGLTAQPTAEEEFYMVDKLKVGRHKDDQGEYRFFVVPPEDLPRADQGERVEESNHISSAQEEMSRAQLHTRGEK